MLHPKDIMSFAANFGSEWDDSRPREVDHAALEAQFDNETFGDMGGVMPDRYCLDQMGGTLRHEQVLGNYRRVKRGDAIEDPVEEPLATPDPRHEHADRSRRLANPRRDDEAQVEAVSARLDPYGYTPSFDPSAPILGRFQGPKNATGDEGRQFIDTLALQIRPENMTLSPEARLNRTQVPYTRAARNADIFETDYDPIPRGLVVEGAPHQHSDATAHRRRRNLEMGQTKRIAAPEYQHTKEYTAHPRVTPVLQQELDEYSSSDDDLW
mmetsp:Transcript_9394/g.17309  ORF Transcript_9394/g.17309 Transcript_9394/m.17309 type:complete len:268 (-) Transcript_9394:1414-2217(-)